MANVVIYDPNHPVVANKVIRYLQSVNTPDYDGQANTLINPVLDTVISVAFKYWKVDAGVVVEMNQTEKDAIDQNQADTIETSIRTTAKAYMDDFNDVALILKALADIIKDEINILRAQHGLADRTLAQLKTAIKDRVDSGDVD